MKCLKMYNLHNFSLHVLIFAIHQFHLTVTVLKKCAINAQKSQLHFLAKILILHQPYAPLKQFSIIEIVTLYTKDFLEHF